MAVTVARTEKGYERNAWILLVLALIFFLPWGFEVGPLAYGFMIFPIIISVTAYRELKRWAWYALWLVPLITVLEMIMNYGNLSLILVLILSLLGLLLPVRKFFPAKQT
jgi:hypothetical protein